MRTLPIPDTLLGGLSIEAFLDEFCIQNPAIGRFSTSVVVDPVKVGLSIAVDADEGHSP